MSSYIQKIDCDKRRVRELFFAAHKRHIKLSKVEVLALFKACVKEANAGLKKEDKEQNKDPTTLGDKLKLMFGTVVPNIYSHVTSNAPSIESQSFGRCKRSIDTAVKCTKAMQINMKTDKSAIGTSADGPQEWEVLFQR